MEAVKNALDDFVTVVSVGSQPVQPENFVTVLSIGLGKRENEDAAASAARGQGNGMDAHLEEEVEVFRLPGERLGFGLKFEGGNKTSEKVRRLFVQSCTDQSPASRAKCSWGALGEGDEVLSIDGVPVTHMTRLDCVRRLKESQLVIKLVVRCRGALRPEVVSAERKCSPEKNKVPPELPSAPPPVPPRKLRHPRGSADGEANPSPVKKSWDTCKSVSTSENSSPQSQASLRSASSKSTSYESCNSSPKNASATKIESPKSSPDLAKTKKEPPEAMVYLDARSQDDSSTHGSTSDDTGSSMSTVVDRFSTSDRFSTISTISTTSTASEHQGDGTKTEQQPAADHCDKGNSSSKEPQLDATVDNLDLSRMLCSFEQLERDFGTNPPDYLLTRLANSEAVTFVESLGDGGVVERVTSVVAPNTVLIEETITLQPPLSFQDAPLSYGHETRPGLFYTDLAGDSATHFRPIKDDAAVVECVNGDTDQEEFREEAFDSQSMSLPTKAPPPLPARNHVNRICVGQTATNCVLPLAQKPEAPVLPPKPLPRKDIKTKRKRPPPPPPPPPPPMTSRRDVPPLPNNKVGPVDDSLGVHHEDVDVDGGNKVTVVEIMENGLTRAHQEDRSTESKSDVDGSKIEDQNGERESLQVVESEEARTCVPKTSLECDEVNGMNVDSTCDEDSMRKDTREDVELSLPIVRKIGTYDTVDELEMNRGTTDTTGSKKPGTLNESSPEIFTSQVLLEDADVNRRTANVSVKVTGQLKVDEDNSKTGLIARTERKKLVDLKSSDTLSTEIGVSDEEASLDKRMDDDSALREVKSDASTSDRILEKTRQGKAIDKDDAKSNVEFVVASKREEDSSTKDDLVQRELDDEETYRSLDEVKDDLKSTGVKRILNDEDDIVEGEDTTDESDDDDYYWQSNLATIGEEEESNSLEYTSGNRDDTNGPDVKLTRVAETSELFTTRTKDVPDKSPARDEVDCVRQVERLQLLGTEDRKTENSTVNGRMDNCGGGQRLPPDGDEFPAAYQEFNAAQQYQFVTATRTTTMTTNGSLVCGESQAFAVSESFKLLPGDGKNGLSTEKTIVNATTSVLLQQPDSRIIVQSVVDNVKDTPMSSVPETFVADRQQKYKQQKPEEIGTRNDGYTSYGTNVSSSNTLISEKKIEIAGYYHKDVPTTIVDLQDTIENPSPPPLPSTKPPKVDSTIVGSTTTLVGRNAPLEQPHRKFSLNGELRRQDDKSEKSVRDKIAMFSSRSSLESPLFPSTHTVATVTICNNGRRLSKHKSSEDVFADDKKVTQKDKASLFGERTQSSFDLTSTVVGSPQDSGLTAGRYGQKSSGLLQTLSPATSYGQDFSNLGTTDGSLYSSKPVLLTTTAQRISSSVPVTNRQVSSSSESKQATTLCGKSTTKSYGLASTVSSNDSQNASPRKIVTSSCAINKGYNSNCTNAARSSTSTSLNRATSFSGGSASLHGRSQSLCELPPSTQVSRTNSLVSGLRRPSEDIRRSSLNQLIEQRRKGMSKLRGLVIPEKEAVPVVQPIIDLPEIKSRDSILLHQVPKANIQDKWGSQSSLASTVSTSSKTTSPFKMPAPQILSKYSPAFKRKSLAVYGSSSTSASSPKTSSPTSGLTSDAPKSLESICSPTRSDYSFDFVSSGGSKATQKKTRMDYDDSDNDSAVSSSQSSMSRGFSPPMSPVPSERSTVSSERSYLSTATNYQRSTMLDSPSRNFIVRESCALASEKGQFNSRPSALVERTYLGSDRSSSSSSSSPNPCSPQLLENNSRNSHIPQQQQQQVLKRSSSTDTNCSTSSTLTSGSQASAESLSRRVLKPQSVEAINRKNILASARCRSGRDLHGSPLIQRKFSDDEEIPTTKLVQENGSYGHQHPSANGNGGSANKQDVKIAYIEVTEAFSEDESPRNLNQKIPKETKTTTKRSIPLPTTRTPKSEVLEPSNDLKMWVRSEVKALVDSSVEKSSEDRNDTTTPRQNIHEMPVQIHVPRSRSSLTLEEQSSMIIVSPRSKSGIGENNGNVLEIAKPRSRSSLVLKKSYDDQNDLLPSLITKCRSRSTVRVEEVNDFGKSKSQMSLEDLLTGKAESKLLRSQSVTTDRRPEKNGVPLSGAQCRSIADARCARKTNSNDLWSNDNNKSFVSKIPTPERTKLADNNEESDANDKSRSLLSKIPTSRTLGRRSASVTDMKKALEKTEIGSPTGNQLQTTSSTHNRFPSLDSSVEETVRNVGSEVDADRYCSEQFGSISSLASSTSLISQQELAQLVEEASLEEARGAHDVIVVLLHKENPTGSVGIALAGGVDCEAKEITVHRVLAHSIADKDGRVQRGDRILSINGRSTRGLNHRESLAVLKQPRSEIVLVVSRARDEEGCKLRSRTESVETIVEGLEVGSSAENVAWGPATTVAIFKGGAGLGFSLEGGRDSPLGDRALVIKKIFTGGAAEKTGALRAGDQLLEVNGNDVTRMSRIEAWSFMKKLHDGEVNLLVRHPATKSS